MLAAWHWKHRRWRISFPGVSAGVAGLACASGFACPSTARTAPRTSFEGYLAAPATGIATTRTTRSSAAARVQIDMRERLKQSGKAEKWKKWKSETVETG
jgi:hypothetical protein